MKLDVATLCICGCLASASATSILSTVRRRIIHVDDEDIRRRDLRFRDLTDMSMPTTTEGTMPTTTEGTTTEGTTTAATTATTTAATTATTTEGTTTAATTATTTAATTATTTEGTTTAATTATTATTTEGTTTAATTATTTAATTATTTAATTAATTPSTTTSTWTSTAATTTTTAIPTTVGWSPSPSRPSTPSPTNCIPKDCEAETYPPDGWDCDDDEFEGGNLFGRLPASHRNCEEGRFIERACATDKEKVLQKCGVDGTREESQEFKGGSISVDLPFSIRGVPVNLKVDVKYEKGTTKEVHFKKGAHGCGQCVAWWMHGLVCKRTWKYQTYDPIYGTPVNPSPVSTPSIVGHKCRWREIDQDCKKHYGASNDDCDREPRQQ